MSIMTTREASECTYRSLEKGKKGVVAVCRLEDGTLYFCAPNFHRKIELLEIHWDDQVFTENSFQGLLAMKSNSEKADHWASFLTLSAENSTDDSPQLEKSTLIDPCEFTCVIVMKNEEQLDRGDEDTSKWLTYRMYLHGTEGVATLVQDDGTARLAFLEMSVARRKVNSVTQQENAEVEESLC